MSSNNRPPNSVRQTDNPSLPGQRDAITRCIERAAKKRKISGACIYGSRIAGYARQGSDLDIILVLERYPYLVNYHYLNDPEVGKVSVLAVDRQSLEKDARSAFLGEFVVGRLLHIYDPIINPEFFSGLEVAYKKRVILEELEYLRGMAGSLSSDILFPLEYVVFSKIRKRISAYPNAAFSYYRTYTGERLIHNLNFALEGYRKALREILKEEAGTVALHANGLLSIFPSGVTKSNKQDRRRPGAGASRRRGLSYIVHTYAGTKSLQYALVEAESKIRRHVRNRFGLPGYLASPRSEYLRLPEGLLIFEDELRKGGGKSWFETFAESIQTPSGPVSVSFKRRLGNVNSRTMLYILESRASKENNRVLKKIVVKELSRIKAVKWAALNVWTSYVRRFQTDPLFRLGTEYKALRYLRELGLFSPHVEALVLDRRLLVTEFIEGKSVADVIGKCLTMRIGRDEEMLSGDLAIVKETGNQIARIHAAGACLGNAKSKNILVSGSALYFTDLEQFLFSAGDTSWDIAQFLGWSLKRTANSEIASRISREFLSGYLRSRSGGRQNSDDIAQKTLKKLTSSKKYLEPFYPVVAPSVMQKIKKEIESAASA